MASQTLPAGYTVAAPVEPAGWYYDDATQQMANHLPQHSKIRMAKHSVGQTFLNAAYGIHLSEFERRLELVTRQRTLATYPLDELDVMTQVEIPDYISLDPPTTRVNHVPNSGFEMRTNPARLPDFWQKRGAVSVVGGLEGRNGVRLTVSANNAQLFSDLRVRILANDPWVASVWYKIPTNVATAPGSNFGLLITASHVDGTSTTVQGVFSATTEGTWRRLRVPVQFVKESSAVRIEVRVYDTFSFASYVEVDCVQLEPGAKSTPWRPDILDQLPYLEGIQRAPCFLAGTDTAFYVDNLTDFWGASLPTRASYIGSEAGSFATVATAGSVPVTDTSKQTWRFTYETIGSTILKRGIDVPDDQIRELNIVTRRYDGKFEQIADPQIETLTYFADRLWLVVKEVGIAGPIRSLYVIDPKVPHPEPSYLTAITGVQITGISQDASIVRAEFLNEDRQHIYLSTSSTRHQIRLHYDLFTVDRGAGLMYLREDPAAVTIL